MKPPGFTRRAAAGSLVTGSVLILAFWPGPPAFGQATTNCFADRVASFTAGTVSAPPAFNSWQPPPGLSIHPKLTE